MGIDAVEAALRIREAEVSDQPVRDAVGLQPGEGWIFRLGLLSIEKFKAAEAKALVCAVEVIASEALLEERAAG